MLHFIYKRDITQADIENVDCARQIILACIISNGFELHPAPHYMLTHFFSFFTLDKTASFFANEASEAFINPLREYYRFGSGHRREKAVLFHQTAMQNINFRSEFRDSFIKRKARISHNIPYFLFDFCPSPWARNTKQMFEQKR
jgi:hypothetical protein